MRRAMVLLGLAGALVLAGAAAVGAGAPDPAPTMTVTPAVVPYGEGFTVSGTGCVDDPPTDLTTSVAVYGRGLADDTPTDPQGDLLGVVQVAADGSWTFSYQIPESAPVRQQDGSFTRAIRATCGTLNPPLLTTTFDYDPVEVRFEGRPAPSTTSPDPRPEAPVLTEPSPATAVAAIPEYTG